MALREGMRLVTRLLVLGLGTAALPIAAFVAALVFWARPFPIVCSFGAVMFLGACLLSGPAWAGLSGRDWKFAAVTEAAQVAFAIVLLAIVLPFQLVARERAHIAKAANDAEQIGRLIAKEGTGGISLDTWTGPYGGRFHVRQDADGPVIVWCDGPDRQNDNGKPIPAEWYAVERSFTQCYAPPLHYIERAVHRCVTSEVLGPQEPSGDIVFNILSDGTARLQIAKGENR